MELTLCTDNEPKPRPLSSASDTQEHDVGLHSHPSENGGHISHVFGAEEIPSLDPESHLIEKNTDRAQSNTSLNMSQSCQTPECCDSPQALVSVEGENTCQTTDPVPVALNEAAAAPSPAEALSGPRVNDLSDDSDAGGLLRSLSHHSEGLDGDAMAVPLSELYIFESEGNNFTLCPHLGSPGVICSVAEIQFSARLEAGDSFPVVAHDEDVVEDQMICQYESEERDRMHVEAPAVDACDVAQQNTNGVAMTMRNDSPIELWLDACQYFAVENAQGRHLSVSVMQEPMSNTASDSSVSSEETQRSGCSQNPCDTIGWAFDDNKSWGPPVERWSSVDSWASALSDWAEIISSPPEDLTAAFTEIGAEIDALTQALAEVTTQLEIGQQSEKPKDVLDQSNMGVQDKPLDSRSITESSVCSEQSLTCCGGEIQEKASIEPMCLTKMTRCQSKQQYVRASEVTTAEHYCQERTVLSVAPGSTTEAGIDVTETRCDSFKTDEVVLNIVEETDVEFSRASSSEPRSDNQSEVKNKDSVSSRDSVVGQDTQRRCAPPEALKVAHQVNAPEEDGTPGLNVRRLPNALASLDEACQVELLKGSPDFIMPSALPSIGSSLVTQATSCSLNGDQKATGWARDRDSVYDPSDASDSQPKPGDVTDFSSESSEDVDGSRRTDTDSSTDLNRDEVTQCFATKIKNIFEESRDLLNLLSIPNDRFTVCEEKRVACFTLDLNDPFVPFTSENSTMPHKTHSSSEGKTRSKKDRPASHPHGAQTSKKPENLRYNVEVEPCTLKENIKEEQETILKHKDGEKVIESTVVPQKEPGRRHSKKKKKHLGKSVAEFHGEAEGEAKADNARSDVLQEKHVARDSDRAPQNKTESAEMKILPKDKQKSENDELIKKRRLAQDKFGKMVSSLESKLNKGATSKAADDKAEVLATRRKAYSEVVKQKSVKPKQDLKVVKPVQAASVSGDPQSLCLWCQFSDVPTDYTVTWRKDGAVLTETKRSAGDESKASLTISNASHQNLGKYQCEVTNSHGTVTLDFLLTYELLSEIVVPAAPKTAPAVAVAMDHEEESVHCSRLMFREDFLTDQFFGESHSASIVTEKVHFGEGMHRRAFRTTLQAGRIPLLLPGHACVLKVHNAISYGTNNSDELVQKNFNLAVEECQVQNTAREYIKAYTADAQSFEAFGPVPEIIPIYLVHRPSNDIPYATLEEELFGDFVKYSVKDGKEINVMRKDSEAGQKCCAFQHWVYHHTDGNLLVTDMQGVGMKLTDVGIATCKKGYKGFKGNCATSFIEQFKALHQCNTYCEILGLKSLQPKPKKSAPALKSKAPPAAAPKKKSFECSLKGKS